MKTVNITFCILIMLTFLGLNVAKGQWGTSGANIYNTNAGNVGIGNSAPVTLLHVGKNMTEPTITVQNLGGSGGATYTMTDNASGANWKFKATGTGGFKIRDHANAMDVITIEPNSNANSIYINSLGYVGLGKTSPVRKLDVAGKVNISPVDDYPFMYFDIDAAYQDGNCGAIYKSAGTYKAWIYWKNTENLLSLNTSTSGSRYDLTISGDGSVGIHTPTPAAARAANQPISG